MVRAGSLLPFYKTIGRKKSQLRLIKVLVVSLLWQFLNQIARVEFLKDNFSTNRYHKSELCAVN